MISKFAMLNASIKKQFLKDIEELKKKIALKW